MGKSSGRLIGYQVRRSDGDRSVEHSGRVVLPTSSCFDAVSMRQKCPLKLIDCESPFGQFFESSMGNDAAHKFAPINQ